MANTYVLISSNTLTSAAASVTFSSIPSTYTDLVFRISARTDRATTTTAIFFAVNSTTTGHSYRYVQGDGSIVSSSGTSSSQANFAVGDTQGSSSTASTFSSTEVYIPSYTVTQNKPLSSFSATESNAATGPKINAFANLWSNTAAISSINITAAGSGVSFVSGSSFYLYGIKNS